MRRWLVVLLWALSASAQTPAPKPPKAPEYRITGVVLDAASGQTLPAARVSLGNTAGERAAPDRSVLTGPDGVFSFEHLPAGKYQMFAEAVGFPQQGFEQHEAPYLTGVVVGPNIAADHLTFRLQRGNAISGTVLDEFNDPVRQARVTLFRRGLSEGRFDTHISGHAQTNDQGMYKFAPLLPGTYFVAVSARPWYAHSSAPLTPDMEANASPQVLENMQKLDLAFPLTYYSGVTEASRATEIVLHNGDRVTADMTLHSVPAVRVHVHATEAEQGNNSPTDRHMQFPSVRLVQRVMGDIDLQPEFEQRGTGEELLFTGLPPGHYEVHMDSQKSNGDRVQELDISGETTIEPETISAIALGSIKGVVHMGGNAASPADLVVLLAQHGKNVNAAQLGEKGEFSFNDLEPGAYELSVTNTPGIFVLQIVAANGKVNGRSVTVSGFSPVELTIELGKGMGEIRGVALQGERPLGGTMVLLAPEHAVTDYVLFRRDQSDSDGTFALAQVVPGKYSLMAIDGGWDLEWTKPSVLKPYLEKANKIEVTAGGKYNVKVQVQK